MLELFLFEVIAKLVILHLGKKSVLYRCEDIHVKQHLMGPQMGAWLWDLLLHQEMGLDRSDLPTASWLPMVAWFSWKCLLYTHSLIHPFFPLSSTHRCVLSQVCAYGRGQSAPLSFVRGRAH